MGRLMDRLARWVLGYEMKRVLKTVEGTDAKSEHRRLMSIEE